MTLSETYLTSHGLSKSFVTKKLGWAIHEDRITIPIYNVQNEIAYTRTRLLSGTTKFLTEKGSRLSIPYCINKIAASDSVVFAEGEPDVARLWQAGIPAITFPSGVTSSSSIDPVFLTLLKDKTIYIALDTDEAGQSQVAKLAALLSQYTTEVKVVSLPTDIKDICDYFLLHPTEDFYALMNTAKDASQLLLDAFLAQYPIISTPDFLDVDYPQPKWLVESLIRMDGISLIVGESGTGKTIFSLTVAKAISEGTPWLLRFPTSLQRTLILDKENTPADIQKLAKSIVIDSPNIFHLFTSEDYQLMDENGLPTPFANNLTLYIKTNNITTIILDSVIDFLIGDENSSVDVAKNILVWRSIFPNCTILGIHHEGKAPIKGKRSSSDRIRGSSVWKSAAQSILSLSVINPLDPATLLVEHTKVRGGAKCKPFEIRMDIKQLPTESIVTGYTFMREVTEEKITSEKAKDAVIEFLAKNPKLFYTYPDITESIRNDDFTDRTIRTVINEMCDVSDLERIGKGERGDPYKVRLINANSYQEVEEFMDTQ